MTQAARAIPPGLYVGAALERDHHFRLHNGRELLTLPTRDDYTLDGVKLYVPNVKAAIKLIIPRPLSDWRFWMRRFGVVRAQKQSGVVRDLSSLYDTQPATALDLENAWHELATVKEWMAANGVESDTAAAVGIKLLSSPRFAPNFPPLYACLPDEELIRPALYGGRCEVYPTWLERGGTYVGPVVYYDANGAYLDVLRGVALPYPYHPIPYADLRREGVTDATIEERDGLAVLPDRDRGYQLGRKRGTWTNREIRYALDHGARLVEIHGGVSFAKSTRVLQPLGEHLATLREGATDAALRRFFKRIPNALIGRFASPPSVCVNRPTGDFREWSQHPRFKASLVIGEGVSCVELSGWRRSPWYASAWAVAVLAEQRLRLHAKMIDLCRDGYHVLYCDTDGILVGLNGLPEPATTAAIGGYKVEWRARGALVKGTKAYVAYRDDDEPIIKRAGLPPERARAWERDQAKELRAWIDG